MLGGAKRNLICHYCGKRNRHTDQQHFVCTTCQAENFVDKNGEIADVPSDLQVDSPKRFAQPVSLTETDPIFCRTCLKNQAMYTAALSEFLPDPDDPEYEKFEAALPEFKDRMEKQYPQCCVRCEPKVKAQLKQAMYHARSDHLRRALEKSRARRFANRLGWRSLVVFAAGLGHYTSLTIQVLWHVMGSQSISVASHHQTLADCFGQWPFPESCSALMQSYLWISFMLGLSCIWWNPGWQSRLNDNNDRLKRLSRYYKLEAALLAMRYAIWSLINDVPQLEPHRQKLHSVALVFIVLCAGYASTLVRVDDTPLVNWQSEPAQILTKGQFEPPLISPPSSQTQYSVEDLTSVENDYYVDAWRPPTPPADGDVMDWDPSPATLSAQPRAINYRSTQPTPFYGKLPQLPRGKVFARTDQPEPSQPIGIPIGFFDRPQKDKTQSEQERSTIAQPTFFPDNDRVDTGLENIFGKVFSLHDDAIEIRNRGPHAERNASTTAAPSNQNAPQMSLSNVSKNIAAASIAVVTLVLMWMSLLMIIGDFSPQKVSTIVIVVITVPLLEAVAISTQRASYPKIMGYIAECAALFGLISYRPLPNSLLVPLWNKLVVGALFALLVQEIFTFCASEEIQSDAVHTTKTNLPDVHKPVPTPSSTIQTTFANTAPVQFTPSQPQLSRRDSISSIGSVSSINTTSTASGWKTPITNHRLEMSDSSSPSRHHNTSYSNPATNTFGIGRLGISNANNNNFTVGSSVAGPRTRKRGGMR